MARRRVLFISMLAILGIAPLGSAAQSSAAATVGPAVASSPAASSDATWDYVALGDSLLYARAEDCGGCTSAAELYAQHVTSETGVPVVLHNLTMHNASTSKTLLADVVADHALGRSPEPVRAAIAAADIISITIGFNDPLTPELTDAFYAGTCGGADNSDCFFDTVPVLEANLDAILDEVDELRAGRPTAVRVTNLYNAFIPEVGQPEPYDDPPGYGASVWRRMTETVNEAVCRVAVEHGAVCVDIYHPFNGPDGTASSFGFLGPDMTHPSQLGMDLIADALAESGLSPLR